MADLIQRFVDAPDALTDDELEKVHAKLESDPELREELGQVLRMDQLLSIGLNPFGDHFVEQAREFVQLQDADDGFQEKTVRSVLEHEAKRPKKKVLFWSLALAATLLVTFSTIQLLLRTEKATPLDLTLVALKGTDTIEAKQESGVSKQLTVGAEINAGDILVGESSCQATVRYQDGTEITLLNSGELTFSRGARGAKEMTLATGKVRANVAKQPSGQNLSIKTASAVTTVIGTVFYLEATGSASILSVQEGLVRFKRLADGQTLEVSTDHVANTKWKDFAPAASAIAPFKDTLPALQRSYQGNPIGLPGRIEAENFDLGGEGVAFHITSESRKVAGDKEVPLATVNKARVLDTRGSGEWFEYSVKTTPGTYQVILQAAAEQDCVATLSINGKEAGQFTIRKGAGLSSVKIDGVRLGDETSLVRLMLSGPAQVDWIEFKQNR